MPFVNIRILKGHPQERKDEIARRVTETISEVAKLPKEAMWVVFEDVTADDWYVGQSRVSELQKKAAGGSQVMSGVEIRDQRFEGVVGRSVEFERLATGFIFTEGPLWHRREQVSAVQRHAGRPSAPLERRRTASPPSASRATSRTAWPGTARAG